VEDPGSNSREFTVADAILPFVYAYLELYRGRMPRAHEDALGRFEKCRTPVLGGRVEACLSCGEVTFTYQSCGHRLCPTCTSHEYGEWAAARARELLPGVAYAHAVFTVPQEVRKKMRDPRYQAELYSALMTAAVATVKQFALDPEYMGANPAIMAVLHTWSRTLGYHPHVHVVFSAGGLDKDGKWRDAGPTRFPHQAMAKVFRALFVKLARAAVAGLQLPGSIFHKRWVVHVDGAQRGVQRIIKYLARYVHRPPITKWRIVDVTSTHVTFLYRDKTRQHWLKMTVTGIEFLRRYLQHVLPKRFTRVRYYGVWAPSNRAKLQALQAELAKTAPPGEQVPMPAQPKGTNGEEEEQAPTRCRHCKVGIPHTILEFRRGRYFTHDEVVAAAVRVLAAPSRFGPDEVQTGVPPPP
jgi:hypothetical protein